MAARKGTPNPQEVFWRGVGRSLLDHRKDARKVTGRTVGRTVGRSQEGHRKDTLEGR